MVFPQLTALIIYSELNTVIQFVFKHRQLLSLCICKCLSVHLLDLEQTAYANAEEPLCVSLPSAAISSTASQQFTPTVLVKKPIVKVNGYKKHLFTSVLV